MTRTPRRPRRGRTALPEGERKDRLLQTRVPGDLDDALREEARRQRLTVSQLIRNVLEDTFHLVDGIVANTAQLTAAVRRDAQRLAASARGDAARTAPAADVEAWQEVVVGRDALCDGCNVPLRRGAKALLGVQADPAKPKVWLCPSCSAQL
jgi:hypothetical protein